MEISQEANDCLKNNSVAGYPVLVYATCVC